MNKAPIHTDTKLSPIENAANDYADKHGFRVPYDGSNKFYDNNDVKWSKEGFIAGATSEAAKAYWLSKQGGEGILKKYQTYIDNIRWHIRTNQPTGEALEACNKQIQCYVEIVNDLEAMQEYAATVAGEQGKGG